MDAHEITSNEYKIENIDKVNAIKRDEVSRALKYLAENDLDRIVKRVTIFGSSVTDKCRADSDIDICIDTDTDIKDRRLLRIDIGLSKELDSEYDLLIYSRLGEKFKDIIRRKGVIVYEIR